VGGEVVWLGKQFVFGRQSGRARESVRVGGEVVWRGNPFVWAAKWFGEGIRSCSGGEVFVFERVVKPGL